MLSRLFDQVQPDMITMETIRYMDYAAIELEFGLSLLDEECRRHRAVDAAAEPHRDPITAHESV